MRNWHHIIIKLPQAISKIPLRSPINIGVMEGDVEYEMLSSPDTFGFNYQAVNEGLKDVSRKKLLHFSPSSPVRPVLKTLLNSSTHATSVAGVIAANKNINLPIEGVLSDSSISNFKNSPVNFLINSGIEWHIYENNRIALNTRDVNLNLDNIKLSLYTYLFDSGFTSEQANVPVINSSIAYSSGCWEGANNSETKSIKNSFNYLFDTILAYSRNGRGTLICLAAGNNNMETTHEQFLSNYDYPFIVAASCLTNGTTITNSSEIRAGYSSYGERVDMCAPSSGSFDSQNSPIKRRVFTTTNKFCGDIGTDNEVYKYTITSVIGNNQIGLNSINGLFAGNCLELGDPIADEHEVLIIKSIDSINKVVTFTEDRYFTLNIALLGHEVRVAVLKNNGSITGNQILLNNPKGLGHVGQKFFVGNNQIGHYASISSVINGTIFEFNPQIPTSLTLPANYDIIPDQVILNIQSHTRISGEPSTYLFQINQNDSAKLKSLFKGELVLILGQFNDGTNVFDVSLKAHIEEIVFSNNQLKIEKINLDYITITEIKTIGYGSYTSSFGGTSSASPLLAGVSGLLLQANPNLNVLELKHILKSTAVKIGTNSYSIENNVSRKNYGYIVNNKLGAGRVNAEAAVQLALDWHDPAKAVQKPNLQIADKLNGTTIESVPYTDPVDSPDIWVKPLQNPGPIPLNTIDTSIDQKIYVKIRNTGTRQSFKECDLRVLIAFTDEVDPAFPFPGKWYDQADVKLLSVKEIPIILPGTEVDIEIEWKNIAEKWNDWNPLTNGKRKKAYILAHIAPFDGKSEEVDITNIRKNKQLSCKEIIVSHNEIGSGTTYVPGNSLNITVGTEVVAKRFNLSMENVLTTDLDSLKIKATRKNSADGSLETVLYKKTGSTWSIESGTPDWITFENPTIATAVHPNYRNAVFPHTLKVNDDEKEIKLEIV
jgi:subtilisin family serine protease